MGSEPSGSPMRAVWASGTGLTEVPWNWMDLFSGRACLKAWAPGRAPPGPAVPHPSQTLGTCRAEGRVQHARAEELSHDTGGVGRGT